MLKNTTQFENYILNPENNIGSGAFGEVFLGFNTKTNMYAAIKI